MHPYILDCCCIATGLSQKGDREAPVRLIVSGKVASPS